VVKILGAKITQEVHNHHNFAWHGGRVLCVVRKGATAVFPGQRGFVGGSMGEISVIIEGGENAHAAESMYSTIHYLQSAHRSPSWRPSYHSACAPIPWVHNPRPSALGKSDPVVRG
jgi:tRNA-splicing ligase RtcB